MLVMPLSCGFWRRNLLRDSIFIVGVRIDTFKKYRRHSYLIETNRPLKIIRTTFCHRYNWYICPQVINVDR
jgi:hypothetical protein